MSIHKIRVGSENDLKGQGVLKEARQTIGLPELKKVKTVRAYRLEGISKKETEKLTRALFFEPFGQKYTINKPLITGTPNIIEISYKPGVMNPEVASIIKCAKDLGIKLAGADSSTEYALYGKVSQEKIEEIINRLLMNKTVERVVLKEPKALRIAGKRGVVNTVPIRTTTNEQLMVLSKDKLFLNLSEMQVIRDYFRKIKRDPTDCELETFAQTWSEHCAHKTFKADLLVDGQKKKPLIKRLQQEALKHKKHIVSAFVDNSGVMDFYDGWAICGKVETHNSPSAIEPYGGAMTGSGGVFRDVLGTGLGAKTIASTDIFCFAKPTLSLKNLPTGCLPPDYLLKRVVAGVRDYGNRMGIPTNNGSVHFHDDFRAKPTVIVGAYGIIPKKMAKKGVAMTGDLIVVVGGRTGRDGIHGATFSSAEMTDRTLSVNSSAVQIGNAIEEKRMFDALYEVREKNLLRAIQDCGAGGFSSAIGEMGEKTGLRVDLAKAPLKYQGLSPWEIWVSESQERMILAVPKNKIKRFMDICRKYNVEASVLGKFRANGKLQVYFGKEKVCDLDMKFLHHGLQRRKMIAKKPARPLTNTFDKISLPKTQNAWINLFKKVLSSENICSKEPIVRLYDHSVQGTNAMQPYSGEKLEGPNDAAILRPLLDKPYGLVISHGLNPALNNLDPYEGSIWAAVEALSNYVAVGGDYKEASLINNYIWPFPDEESLWSLDRSVEAVVEIMRKFKIPVISGKDSLSSTYRSKNGEVIKIPPVLCISVFGKILDVEKTISSDFKKEKSAVALVGEMDWQKMGGSVYFDILKEEGHIPKINLKKLPRTFNSIYKAIQKGQILSCHDVSEGGLLTTVFEMCVGGDMGAKLHLGRWRDNDLDSSDVKRLDFFLFNETAGCFIVELEDRKIAKKLFKNVPYIFLGETQKEKTISVFRNKKKIFQADLEDLKKTWQEPMKRIFS